MDVLLADPLYAIYLLMLVISVIICFTLIGYLWKQRIVAVIPVIGILIAIILWSTGYFLEHVSRSFEMKLFMYNIEYLGIANIPVFFLLFSLEYARLKHLITRRRLILLFIIPAITIVLVWTKEMHTLMYQNITMVEEGNFYSMNTYYGIWFWIYLAYSYLVTTAGVLVLFLGLFRKPHLERNQVFIIIAIVMIPFLCNITYVFRLLPNVSCIDWTGSAFAVSAIFITIAITKQRLLDIRPVARDSTIEMLNDGYLVLDAQSYILDLNDVMHRIIGSPTGKLIGKKLPDSLSSQVNTGINSAAKKEIALDVDGEQKYYRVHSTPLRQSGCKSDGNILLFYDITESKQFENKLADMATHDYLTGLPNRAILKDRFSVALARAKRNNSKFAAILCDIDNFKSINDTYGHMFGDRMLQAIASRLNGVMRAEDTLSRIGGDEFVILLPQVENREEPSIVAKRVLKSFQDAFLLEDRSIHIVLSLGMSLYPENGMDMMTLLKNADDAMYGVKRKGGAGYCMHGDC